MKKQKEGEKGQRKGGSREEKKQINTPGSS
jgi:hypothetical protein